MSLKGADCILPPDTAESADQWGELLLGENRPEGAAAGRTGASYEARGLNRRARGATRPVPIPPVLVKMLRDHIATYGAAPDGRLFRAARGGRVRSTEYCDLWSAARTKALSEKEAASPLAARRGPGTASPCFTGSTPRPSRGSRKF